MQTLIIYDSVFGNTEQIARAIADSLRSRAPTELLHVDQAQPERVAGFDLLVVGSPTRGFRPTEAVAALLKAIRSRGLHGMKTAAFYTRFKADELESKGVQFIVKTGG
jgi:menaquinone-dependent protoporphyrinogen IX oxidase